MYFLICCSASLTLPSEPQLFMSVQSDLYDLMFDRFEYKEQVTTCDLHDCKIPLCLTERSSLAVAHSPPDSFAVLLMHRSVNAAGSWAGPRGKVSVGSDSAALLPNPLPLGAGLVPLNLGRGFPLSAAQWPRSPSLPVPGNSVPVEEIPPQPAWPWENVSPFIHKQELWVLLIKW